MMWLNIVLYVLVVLILVWLASILYRQVLYKKIDRLDEWKAELEQRPFSEQLSRVKNLHMAGETEKLFDQWRADWEDILTTSLPQIEASLLDIEDCASGIRFVKSRRLMEQTAGQLTEIEQSLEKIMTEIDHLMQTEKQNHKQSQHMQELFHKLQASLQQHSVELGIAYPVLHERCKMIRNKFQEFHDLQSGGNYYRSREQLDLIQGDLDELTEAIEKMPDLLYEIEHAIPLKLHELQEAVQEMKEQGYPLEQTDIEKKLETFEEWRFSIVDHMEQSDVKRLEEWLEETRQTLEDMFERLEQEVEDKSFVVNGLQKLETEWESMHQQFEGMKTEVDQVKENYEWDEEWEEALRRMNRQIEQLHDLYKKCHPQDSQQLHEQYPVLKPNLEYFQEQRHILLEDMNVLEQQLQAIREDEWKAQEVLKELQQKMHRLKMEVHKSNLPGLPEYVRSGINMAEQALQELAENLAQKPLSLPRVQHQTEEASSQVTSIIRVTQDTIVQSEQAEFLIHYANRYRNRNRDLFKLIDEAEKAFREYEYREALEFAEEALDEADKNWREKVDLRHKQLI